MVDPTHLLTGHHPQDGPLTHTKKGSTRNRTRASTLRVCRTSTMRLIPKQGVVDLNHAARLIRARSATSTSRPNWVGGIRTHTSLIKSQVCDRYTTTQ
jgi:hypothetical protein